LKKEEKRCISIVEIEASELKDDKCISEVFEESSLGDTNRELKTLLDSCVEDEDKIVYVHSMELYDEVEGYIDKYEVWVDTKYKIVVKKVKLVVL